MNEKLTRLAERREHLVAEAAAQRSVLAKNLKPWRAPLALADRGMAAFHYVRRHPALLAAAVFMIVLWRPKHASRWPRRAWVAWQLGHRLFRN